MSCPLVRFACAALLGSGMALWSSTTAQAGLCPRPAEFHPVVHFVADTPGVVYRRDLPSAALAELKGGIGSHSGRLHVMGLTTNNFGILTSAEFLRQDLPDRTVCYWITKFDIHFTAEDMMVHIARELPEDSCAYRVTLEHENQHVALTRQILDQKIPWMRSVLDATLPSNNPLVSRLSHGNEVQALMKRSGDHLLQELQDAVTRANATLDTPTNYEKTTQRCNDWGIPPIRE